MRMIVLSVCVVWMGILTARADGPAAPLTITSGFNVDAVADGPGSAPARLPAAEGLSILAAPASITAHTAPGARLS